MFYILDFPVNLLLMRFGQVIIISFQNRIQLRSYWYNNPLTRFLGLEINYPGILTRCSNVCLINSAVIRISQCSITPCQKYISYQAKIGFI